MYNRALSKYCPLWGQNKADRRSLPILRSIGPAIIIQFNSATKRADNYLFCFVGGQKIIRSLVGLRRGWNVFTAAEDCNMLRLVKKMP